MKPILLIVLSIFLQASSCKKDDHKNDKVTYNDSLIGRWQLVRMTGGIGGVDITAAEWGHSRQFTFNTDLTYAEIMDGKVTSGTYNLSTDTSSGQKLRNIITIDGNPFRLQYNIAHDTLVLFADGISDVMYDWYVRF